jgi:hypothetical protein
MRIVKATAPFLIALAVIGCSGKQPSTTDSTTTTTGGGGTTGSTTSETPAPTLPDDLKNTAYEYRGLGNEKLKTYSTSLPGQPVGDEGTEQITLDKVENGVAQYKIERTGALSIIGTETMELTKEGVRTIASSAGEVSPYLELSADAAPGKTWSTPADMKTSSRTLKATAAMKVLPNEKLKFEAGEFDCLVVQATINGTVSGAEDPKLNGKSKTEFKVYYAKGVGIVKLTGKSTLPNNTSQNIEITLKSVGT